MNDRIFSVAIDGPAGAGKSTIANLVADKLGIEYIDTGAMYRALTLKVLRKNKDPKNIKEVIHVMKNTEIDFENKHILLDGVIVDEEIRNNLVSTSVSYVSQYKEIRDEMVLLQQNMAKTKSIIMDGRDITTVVLPNADFKFFITASIEERAKRRYVELLEKGYTKSTYQQIFDEITTRDEIDSNREIAPLTIADDAYILDTTDKSIDESVDIIVSMVKGGI